MKTLDELKVVGVDLAKSIVDTAEVRAKKFLDDNAGSREFIAERAKRYGELSVSYLVASSDVMRSLASQQMAVVQQSIENELASVSVAASVASREEFKEILGTVLSTIKTVLPIILSLI